MLKQVVRILTTRPERVKPTCCSVWMRIENVFCDDLDEGTVAWAYGMLGFCDVSVVLYRNRIMHSEGDVNCM
jgi:hypothetical protein